jgi:hypothetical protein
MDWIIAIAIIVVLLAIFRLFTVGLNIILALVIGAIIVYLLYDKDDQKTEQLEVQRIDKAKTLRPPHEQLAEYSDINDFFFSIQDSYHYSPNNYEDAVDAVNDFLTVFHDSLTWPQNAGKDYEIALKKKSDALTALHAMIYRFEGSTGGKVIDKNNRARDELSYILSNYLEEMRKINDNYNRENGMTMESVVLVPESWPKAENYFGDYDATAKGEYTYEVY